MMNHLFSLIFFGGIMFPLPLFAVNETENSFFNNMFAGAFFTLTTTSENLRNEYHSKDPIKVLIVPGHDDTDWGTSFRGIKEADLTLETAKELESFFKSNQEFSATLLRDKNGYNKNFVEYLERERSSIAIFIDQKKRTTESFIKSGVLQIEEVPFHNEVTGETAFRLYAVNTWATRENFDLVLHLHFNDYPRRYRSTPGEYSGFTVYVPDQRFGNGTASKEVGEAIFSELRSHYPPSDLPKEIGGLVEDHELIALGANNTLEKASVLIEYSYIYEPYFTTNFRSAHLKEMAYQTYRGVLRFFDVTQLSKFSETTLLPFIWRETFTADGTKKKDILALQVALLLDGLYPPEGETLRDCPLSGSYRACTKASVKKFQSKYGVEQTGVLGPLTRAKLNELYAPKITAQATPR